MKYDFAVLGANGIQGKIVARHLLESGYSVLLCAIDDYKLDDLINHDKADFAFIDLRKMTLVKRVLKKSGASIVINCAIDDYNLDVAKMCLELGKNCVDLGPTEEKMYYEHLELDKAYKEKDIIGITGIGSTPGINNVMLRYAKPQFDTIETVHLGFSWNSNMPVFVTPFSMDAIAFEFTDKAKTLEDGKFVEKAPEECNTDYYYKSIGKQKTCHTKHIEHHTFYEYLKDMGVKNISVFSSFPSHSYNTIKNLIDLGFTSKQPIEVDGKLVRPLDFTIEAVRHIPIPEEYTEKENLWLKIWGKKDGKDKLMEMDCVAGTLPGWEENTCNIDTGIPASILAQMIKNGVIKESGVFSPEFIVPAESFFEELGKNKIWVYENGRKIN